MALPTSSRRKHRVPLRHLLPMLLLASLLPTTHAQVYSGNITDYILAVLNGSVPLGRIDSILFTQMNRFNIFGASISQRASNAFTARLPARLRGSPGAVRRASSGSGSRSSSSVGLLTHSSHTTASTPGVAAAVAAAANRGFRLNSGLHLSVPAFLRPRNRQQHPYDEQRPSDKVALGPRLPILSPQAFVRNVGQKVKRGRVFDLISPQDDDDDDDDDDEEEEDRIIEPRGRVRIQKYTSPENITIVRFRVKSKWSKDVRSVQIRQGEQGKTGPLVMNIPGSWRLTKVKKFRLAMHVIVVNVSDYIVENGQDMDTAIAEMTVKPWEYYALLTTQSKPNGAIRGNLWKPFCPWCANYTWGGT